MRRYSTHRLAASRAASRLLILLTVGMMLAACGGSSAGEVAANQPIGLQRVSADTAPEIVYASPDAMSAGLPTGVSEVEDDDGDAQPSAPGTAVLPIGVDITGASLESDGSQLLATWSVPAPTPRRLDDGSTLTWLIHLWQDDKPVYQLVVQLKGADWSIYSRDAFTGREVHFRLASFYADRVEAPFSAASLPGLGGRFTWLAEVTWHAPDGRVWFDRSPEQPRSFP